MSNESLTEWQLLTGRNEPPPQQRPLRAGPLTMVFESGDLRYLKLGGREVIRRIYAAVRDQNWGTVLSEISDLKLQTSRSASLTRARIVRTTSISSGRRKSPARRTAQFVLISTARQSQPSCATVSVSVCFIPSANAPGQNAARFI